MNKFRKSILLLVFSAFFTQLHAYQNPSWSFNADDCTKAGARCIPPEPTEWIYVESPMCSGPKGGGIPESEQGETLVKQCILSALESSEMPPKGLGNRCSNVSMVGHGWVPNDYFPYQSSITYSEKVDRAILKYKFWDVVDSQSGKLDCVGEGESKPQLWRKRYLRCPDGFLSSNGLQESATIQYCYRVTEQERICRRPIDSSTQYGQYFGNPVATVTGEKFQAEHDWTDSAGLDDLSLIRLYRSDWAALPPPPGGGWLWAPIASLHKASKDHIAVRLPDGSLRRFSRDSASSQPLLWRASGHASKLSVDVDKYLYSHSEDGSQWLFSQNGKLLNIIFRNGWRRNYLHGNGSLIIKDNFGRMLTILYDSYDRPKEVTTPDGQIIKYFYNEEGQLESVSYPDGSHKIYTYKPNNRTPLLSGITDENGNSYSKYQYDDLGRAIFTSLAGGVNGYSFKYNDGVVPSTTVTDPLGGEREYWFTVSPRNGVANITSTTRISLNGSGTRWRTISDAGLVVSEKDSYGTVTARMWDETRLLPTSTVQAVGKPEARGVNVTWHPQWQLPTSISNAGSEVSYSYDVVGNLLSQTSTDIITSAARTTSWTYHPSGLVATETAPNGAVTSYQYDDAGNLTSATGALGHVDSYTHDAAGRVLTHTAPTGVTATYTYDARGRMLTASVDGQVTTLTYRPSGQVSSARLPHGHVITYTYDDAQRLTDWSDNRGASATYVLDGMGNRTFEQVRNAQDQAVWTLVRGINSLNRVASTTVGTQIATIYNYDANGDLISATNGLGEITRYGLDALRRVQAITDAESATASLTYNALDSVTQASDFKGVATTYERDALGNARAEASPDAGT
ncbi:DUF6531 domain-containing protein, partial [Acidovorax sp. LjRoot117]|uniref:DUF6531 domain-containing protein n=1 Tax=Acidovorax sp. LjRoot117 TaxID=3342255 RepID=UPI003F50C223